MELREAERLDTLAARINAKHRAVGVAVNSALGHALAAGDLLLQAKAERPHGTWGAWLEENFEGSARTAQAYLLLAHRRAEIEAANAQSSAHLSIDEALRFLGRSRPTPPLEREQEARRRAREREEQRLNERAEYAIRTGNLDPPTTRKYPPESGNRRFGGRWP
jgi:hypothetical protein